MVCRGDVWLTIDPQSSPYVIPRLTIHPAEPVHPNQLLQSRHLFLYFSHHSTISHFSDSNLLHICTFRALLPTLVHLEHRSHLASLNLSYISISTEVTHLNRHSCGPASVSERHDQKGSRKSYILPAPAHLLSTPLSVSYHR